jgi:hypothetical protein
MTNFKCESDGVVYSIKVEKDGDVTFCVNDKEVYMSNGTAHIIGVALCEAAKGERNE